MKQGGRPRSSEEQPDSAFGVLLKEHIRRVPDFNQAKLASESVVSERALSWMVKGRRESGTTLRRDLRAIIKVLYRKKALSTLEEANALMTAIPTVSALDDRDAEDAEIIALFNSPGTEQAQATYTSDDEGTNPNTSSNRQDDVASSQAMPEPILAPTTPVPDAAPARRRTRLWCYIASGAAVLMLTLAVVIAQLFSSQQPNACSPQSNGVTLYTNSNYQGQCRTFGPGEYDLAQFGLAQNVSSINDGHDSFHITLFDKAKNFYYIDKDTPMLPAEWNKRADMIHIEKHRQTTCHPGSDGITAFIDPDYSGGCLFITHTIPDLTPLNFDSILVSIQFVGNYQNTRQLVIYKQPHYKEPCGTYWQNQSDLLQCARVALSLQVLPFTPPTPIPTARSTHYAGNVASQASLSPGSAHAVVDRDLQTEWIGGHLVGFDLRWAFPVTIDRVVVWDRKQSSTDNNQINKLKLSFSDGTFTGSIDMVSQGPRCADITFPAKTITSLQVIPVDASGSNGFREIEVWATDGPQYSNNTCVNKKTVSFI